MTEKDLLLKLNNLKNIQPDETWLKSNRELLLAQISNSGAQEISPLQNFVINLASFAKAASRPVYAFGIFVFVLISASVFSNKLFSSAKPNDSLYIARVISEQAKLSTVINQESRDKLAVQFANDRAQDISAVLADPNFNNDKNKVAVAKLNTSFNEEIATVKNKIQNLTPAKNNVAQSATLNNDAVSIAENNKDAKGVQLFVANPNDKTATSNLKIEATSTLKNLNPTTTLDLKASTTEVKKDSVSTENIINEAQKLFDSKDYSQASDKLKEVDQIIK